MKRFGRMAVWAAFMLIFALQGCGKAPEPKEMVNPEKVSASLHLEPEPPKAGEPAVLVIEITGPVTLNKTKVSLDLKVKGDGKPMEEVDLKPDNKGRFSVPYTFKEPGSYNAVIHVYSPEVHKIAGAKFEVK